MDVFFLDQGKGKTNTKNKNKKVTNPLKLDQLEIE